MKKSLQLLSVEPLFSADSTRKLVSVLEAKSNWANKGGFITLHSIPTQITLSAPEDVTIRLGSVDGKTGKSPFSMTTSLADDERSDSKGGDEDGDKMAVFMKYFNKTQAKLFKEWGYEKNKPGVLSPKLWGFRHEWKVCRSGKAQSPVNMEREGMRGVGLDPLGWMCGSSPCESFNSTESASKQSFDGHALVVEAFDGDGTPKLTANSETYSLEQLTLHTPSEHTLDGAHFDLEVQMMHRSETGKGLAVSVLMEAGEGNESPSWIEALSAVVKPCLLSTDSADCLLGSTPSHLAKSFSFRDFATSLGGLQHYYNYNGSHTAPPCNEDVQWNILRSNSADPPLSLKESVQCFFLNILHLPHDCETQFLYWASDSPPPL